MIKKVKITDIHPIDMYYGVKDKIIGTIVTLDIDEDQYMKGWSSSRLNGGIMMDEKGNYSGMCFTAFKYEEVE